ncbi:MAG: undecaprenyl/decaprenyl-phosphate alpha-N-acetylglucosaminyl 1-phosphate transferase [Agathobaculum sp.]|uniref:MraY family glycosyltransferase n=1 Tax=Agathobaculum sp. TaxID=2048138 RepID=UPI0025BAAA2B|nr:MraY family glycosyltransferase [Agathobaculum sp.]MCI7126133.1 undecaprenyl/decaprenyl-phosphate alpha-N-acetylglucosaminyl 1-phosphate transferase [Agathobaculum sp.]MDY3711932.1 MraY family glycosyltransferase [Agathobaculum sp.]
MPEYIVIGKIIAAFIAAGVLAYLFTPHVKRFAQKIGAIDVPKDNRRMHREPIPRLGGLAIFGGFLCAILIFGKLDQQMLCVLLGAIIIVVLGMFDDVMALSAKLKFVVQIVAAAIPVCVGGLQIRLFTNLNPFSVEPYFHLGIFAIPVTILWIVGITNAVNLIDGLDGLAVGVSSIAAITMLAVALLTGEMLIAVTMGALAGACIGFMPYNLNPAKIFMGDTGSTFLGYMLATISIMGLFKFYAVISFAVPFLILGLPIFDTTNAIIRRVAAGRSPMSPDRGHVHHKLIDMGFNQKQAVAILYAISATLGLTAVVLTSSGEVKALVLLLAVLVAILVGACVIYGTEHWGKHTAEDTARADEGKEDAENE